MFYNVHSEHVHIFNPQTLPPPHPHEHDVNTPAAAITACRCCSSPRPPLLQLHRMKIGVLVVARAGAALAASDDAEDADAATADKDDFTDDIAEVAAVADTLASASICSADISSRMRRESSNLANRI